VHFVEKRKADNPAGRCTKAIPGARALEAREKVPIALLKTDLDAHRKIDRRRDEQKKPQVQLTKNESGFKLRGWTISKTPRRAKNGAGAPYKGGELGRSKGAREG